MRHKRLNHPYKLSNMFFIGLIYSLIITIIIISFISFLLIKLDIVNINYENTPRIYYEFGAIVLGTSLIRTFVSGIICMILIKPINDLVNGLDSLSVGNYDTRVNLGKGRAFTRLANSFNKLATELQNTEMLRSDFVNNFSHEFKTPIVSIRGFAKLLQKDNLPIEKQKEYLEIIVNESTRLSHMATKVLELTKLENQTILTDVSKFNLSEQVRRTIVLLEREWSKKNIEMNIDFDEHEIFANEGLLEHVWINLLENAIKFSPINSEIGITIREDDEFVRVSVRNHGDLIGDNEQNRIFNKFYQIDKSHSTSGNGIGLAIVKKIVELHEGSVDVKVVGTENVFCVNLPKTNKHL